MARETDEYELRWRAVTLHQQIAAMYVSIGISFSSHGVSPTIDTDPVTQDPSTGRKSRSRKPAWWDLSNRCRKVPSHFPVVRLVKFHDFS